MFDVPFLYGGGWRAAADSAAEPVIVLSKKENEILFGGINSVGRTIRWNDLEFRIVGVLDDWFPHPKFYDLTGDSFAAPEDTYHPLRLDRGAPDGSRPTATTTAGASSRSNTFKDYLNADCVWIQMWVELPDARARERMQTFIDSYWAEQRKAGRFERPRNNRLTDVKQWLVDQQVVENDDRILVGLAFAFLAVCLINTVGLLLAKFLNGAALTGVRRALGASRRQMFIQHMVETGLLAGAGALLGLVLAAVGLWGLRTLYAVGSAVRRQRLPGPGALRHRQHRHSGDPRRHRGTRRRDCIPPGVSDAYPRPSISRVSEESNMSLNIRPILSSLLRNRTGAVLVALQIALALAILVNAAYIVKQRVDSINRPTGIDDANMFVIAAAGFTSRYDYATSVRDDLDYLRGLDGVIAATPSNGIPLSGNGSAGPLYTTPEHKDSDLTIALMYEMDEQGVQTLGSTHHRRTRLPQRGNPAADNAGQPVTRHTADHRDTGPGEQAVCRRQGGRQSGLRSTREAHHHHRCRLRHGRPFYERPVTNIWFSSCPSSP